MENSQVIDGYLTLENGNKTLFDRSLATLIKEENSGYPYPWRVRTRHDEDLPVQMSEAEIKRITSLPRTDRVYFDMTFIDESTEDMYTGKVYIDGYQAVDYRVCISVRGGSVLQEPSNQ